MGTRLQGELLEELYHATGETCQLWLATHSVGMMRRARDLAAKHPGEIVFLDFGGRDFDTEQVIRPEKPTRAFWQRVLDIALDDFAALISPREVILCEGSRIGTAGRSEGVDAKIYDQVFGDEFPDTRFIAAGNAVEVETDRLALIQAMQALVQGTTVRRLIDRDDMSQTEVEERRRQKVTVLGRRNIESYFFDDELITALCEKHGKPELSAELITARAEELRKAHVSRARPVDDVKASAGPIMNRIKRTLSLTQCGNSVKDFMRITMAPLMSPETNVYQELRSAIFVSPLPE